MTTTPQSLPVDKIAAAEIAQNLIANGGITKDQATHALDITNANVLTLARTLLALLTPVSEWHSTCGDHHHKNVCPRCNHLWEKWRVVKEHYFVKPGVELTEEELASEIAKFDEAAKRSTPMDLKKLDAELRDSRDATVSASKAVSREAIADELWEARYSYYVEKGLREYQELDDHLVRLCQADAILKLIGQSGEEAVSKALLDERDSFIVHHGLWMKFVDWIRDQRNSPSTPPPASPTVAEVE